MLTNSAKLLLIAAIAALVWSPSKPAFADSTASYGPFYCVRHGYGDYKHCIQSFPAGAAQNVEKYVATFSAQGQGYGSTSAIRIVLCFTPNRISYYENSAGPSLSGLPCTTAYHNGDYPDNCPDPDDNCNYWYPLVSNFKFEIDAKALPSFSNLMVDVYVKDAGVKANFTVTAVAADQTGQIVVKSNVPTSWNLTGPQNFSGSGTYAKYTAKAGATDYFLSAAKLSGYSAPSIKPGLNQLLKPGQTITFEIYYAAAAKPGSFSAYAISCFGWPTPGIEVNITRSSGADTYSLWRKVNSGSWSFYKGPFDFASFDKYVDKSVSAGSTYHYKVIAANGSGQTESNIKSITVTSANCGATEEPAPAAGQIVVKSNVATSWTVAGPKTFAGSGTYASYPAPDGTYKLDQVPASLAAGSQLYLLSGISPASQVLAAPNTVTFTITYHLDEPLPAPAITRIGNACGQLHLEWADHSGNEAGFIVYRSETPSGGDYRLYQRIAALPANAVSYTDRPPLGKSYYYIVAAFLTAPDKTAPSKPYFSPLSASCQAEIYGEMSLLSVNGQPAEGSTQIKDNDAVTLRLLVGNSGTASGYVTKILESLSPTLQQPRNLRIAGTNARLATPPIAGQQPLYTFGVHGKKDHDTERWVVLFDATVDVPDGQATAQFGACSIIHYFDEAGSKTSQACITQLAGSRQEGPGGSGGVWFKEIAP